MVKLDKEYIFHGPGGSAVPLQDLFDGKDQLIVYHFMFGPDAERGCKGCAFVGMFVPFSFSYFNFSLSCVSRPIRSFSQCQVLITKCLVAEHIPDLRHLRSRNTSMAVVSRAPLDRIETWKKRLGWTFPWYSSADSDFNYDFHVTIDPKVGPVEYNFASAAELEAKGLKWNLDGEQPGLSVFLKKDGVIYHTYSTYSRGLDHFLGTYQLLDMTPFGRQDGPKGPAEFKLKYEYDDDA